MSRKRYQPLQNDFRELLGETKLPTDRPIAIYYRQSTDAQIGNMSTALQTVDMAGMLERYGWQEKHIILIDADAGVSGSTKIDEREGMRQLFQLITDGAIGAVACQDEDRLFRDVTQIQVNIFIEACKSSRVLVITPTMVYDFAHAAYGNFHARQFRFKSEMAAEYITSYIKGKLHPAKRRMLMQGRWAGPPIPAGYMIDMRKELANGSPNPDWRKFAIFEPFADIVRAYWDLFLDYNGQLRPTVRHIIEHGPYYPAPGTYATPEGFKVVYRIRQNQGRWCPGRMGLKNMLTNALYIGHWMVNGAVVIRDNHPAIIEPETFMRAFNYLSDVALDGRENLNYNPVTVYAQPMKEEERDDEWPLCAGLIYSEDVDGKWVRVGTRWSKSNNHYAYEHWSRIDDASLWWKKAALIDDLTCCMLIIKMEATFDFRAWEDAVSGFVARYEQEQSLMRSQLKQLETVMENLVASLDNLQHPQMIQAAERRFADAEAEAERLRSELENQAAEMTRIEQVREMHESCGDIVENWPAMSRQEQRQILHAYIERIDATPMENNAVELDVHWKDATCTTAQVPGQAGASLVWTDEEIETLIGLFQSGKDQLEIASALPYRTWGAIVQQYQKRVPVPERFKMRRKRHIKVNETYIDYAEREGIKLDADMSFEAHSGKARPGGPYSPRRDGASAHRPPAPRG